MDRDQIVAMILNQHVSTTLDDAIRLNGDPISSINALRINIEAGLNIEYVNPVGGRLESQSSVLLLFDNPRQSTESVGR